MVKVGIHVTVLTIHETSGKLMTTVKVSSQVEEKTWEKLKILASESQQSISGLLTEAIAEYVQRRRVRPDVQPALVQSINDNKRLGELLVQ
jgi:predicted transcriptional regulator